MRDAGLVLHTRRHDTRSAPTHVPSPQRCCSCGRGHMPHCTRTCHGLHDVRWNVGTCTAGSSVLIVPPQRVATRRLLHLHGHKHCRHNLVPLTIAAHSHCLHDNRSKCKPSTLCPCSCSCPSACVRLPHVRVNVRLCLCVLN